MVLGVIVILVVAILVGKYLKNNNGSIPSELLNQNNSIESSNKTHKVEKGDSLWNIAVKYYGDGFKWVDIATENKLANASVIETGQELIIPSVEENITATEEPVVLKDAISDSISDNSYTVVKGDSLWKIAVRAYGDGYRWVEIAKENKLTNPDFIYSGNVLALPR